MFKVIADDLRQKTAFDLGIIHLKKVAERAIVRSGRREILNRSGPEGESA